VNFRGHLLGGAVAGVTVCAVAVISETVRFAAGPGQDWLHRPGTAGEPMALLGVLFLITLAMALFPDLDVAGKVQRWFYRVVGATLIVLWLLQRMDLFAGLTLVALLPLLHHHRGWTHSRVTPWLIALGVMIMAEIQCGRFVGCSGIAISELVLALKDSWIYILACVLGHYTHLLLDAI